MIQDQNTLRSCVKCKEINKKKMKILNLKIIFVSRRTHKTKKFYFFVQSI